MNPTEKQITYQIIDYLNLSGHYVWKNNSGYMFDEYTDKKGRTKKRGIKIGKRGSSDIIGVHKNGRFLAVEVKRGYNKPTAHQEYFLDEVRRRGGIGIVAYCIEDCQKEGL